MSLYLDVHHRIEGLTPERVVEMHEKDLEVQARYRVNYIKGWFDETSGRVFCLVEAPNAAAATAVHREAHGFIADEIVTVREFS